MSILDLKRSDRIRWALSNWRKGSSKNCPLKHERPQRVWRGRILGGNQKRCRLLSQLGRCWFHGRCLRDSPCDHPPIDVVDIEVWVAQINTRSAEFFFDHVELVCLVRDCRLRFAWNHVFVVGRGE